MAVLVSTFERPRHLERVLASLAVQVDVADVMEVVVSDDGSRDETPEIVAEFARGVDFPVSYTTHEHTTFRLALCRNEGVAASTAPYLVFLDGDCVAPPDYLAAILKRRKPGCVLAGGCCRLDCETSQGVTIDSVLAGRPIAVPAEERRRLVIDYCKARFYNLMRHPERPKLAGGNVGIWRADYESVNGYDEHFEGWGCEDDDLGVRLRMAGLRIESLLNTTFTYHLWHPADVTAPRIWREGSNVRYLNRSHRLARCQNGLIKDHTAEMPQSAPAEAA